MTILRRPRCDRLIHFGVDPSHAKIVKQRVGPLARYFWHRMGSISIEELCMSAYIQGMLDAQQLPTHHPLDETVSNSLSSPAKALPKNSEELSSSSSP